MSNDILKNFHFKHNLGQNFITDTNLLQAIVKDANVVRDDNVLEIGAGAGTLTNEICKTAVNGNIVAVEIDTALTDILYDIQSQNRNLRVVFNDILKIPTNEISSWFNDRIFRVVANLPYYITTPILFYLLESDLNIASITVMVQQEVADRIIASPDTKDYGAITPIIQLYGDAKITRKVNKKMFTPMPKVDSAILHLDINKRPGVDIRKVSKFIRNCFAMRRKTLLNNIAKAYKLSKDIVIKSLNDCGIDTNIRSECLDLDMFLKIYNYLTCLKIIEV